MDYTKHALSFLTLEAHFSENRPSTLCSKVSRMSVQTRRRNLCVNYNGCISAETATAKIHIKALIHSFNYLYLGYLNLTNDLLHLLLRYSTAKDMLTGGKNAYYKTHSLSPCSHVAAACVAPPGGRFRKPFSSCIHTVSLQANIHNNADVLLLTATT